MLCILCHNEKVTKTSRMKVVPSVVYITPGPEGGMQHTYCTQACNPWGVRKGRGDWQGSRSSHMGLRPREHHPKMQVQLSPGYSSSFRVRP